MKRNHTESDSEMMKSKVYMDYNATTPVASSVQKVIYEALTCAWGNPSSSYEAAKLAKNMIQKSRSNIAKMLNGIESEIVFMSGGTEANNHIIMNSVEYFTEHNETKRSFLFSAKPHIITTTVEHDSILKILKHLESKGAVDVSYVQVSKQSGCVDTNSVLRNVRDETVLITVMLANNETGAIQPLDEICREMKKLQRSRQEKNLPAIYIHSDAAQAIGKIKVDVKMLGVDYLTVVGHKFYGPRIGALWVREGCPLKPMLYGGGQESGKRPGTENTCMIAGLGEAAKLVQKNLDLYTSHFEKIRSYLMKRLLEVFGNKVVFNGTICATLPNTLNISFLGSTSLRGINVLSRCRCLQASVGAACHTAMGEKPSAILLAHGIPEDIARNAIRLSVGRETTLEHIDKVVDDLKQAIRVLIK